MLDPNDPREKRAQDDLDKLNEYTNDKWTVGYEEEYLTLYCNGKHITSGCVEVPDRLAVLIRERGLQFYD